MKILLAFVVGLISACSTTSPPAAASPTDAEAQQIAEGALKVFVDSWNRSAAGDTTGHQLYGSQYWPDAELVDPSGNIWNDQPSIIKMHVDLWGTAFKGSQVNGAVRRTRVLSPTLMIADFNLDLKVQGPLPPTIPSSGGIVKAHLKHVLEKRGPDWKVIAAQNTFYSDVPSAR
jgi:uncharacterized protein (TIGR02246 family)